VAFPCIERSNIMESYSAIGEKVGWLILVMRATEANTEEGGEPRIFQSPLEDGADGD
jgi:hypothetical protein